MPLSEELLASAKESLIANGKKSELWFSVANYIYQKVTRRKTLGEDLERYQILCVLYKECTVNNEIPEQWELDSDRCPLYYSTFAETKIKLRSELGALAHCHHSLSTQITGVVAKIARLFVSLSKRSKLSGNYRSDGFESMFLTELAMWFMLDLPRHNITHEATAHMVQRRINYCIKMEKILIFHNDAGKPNPINTLPIIIQELKCMKRYLRHAHQAARFNDNVTVIDVQLQSMVKHTFDILHLMLEGVDQEEFQVLEFTTPGDGRQTRNMKLKQCLLGKWIIETCQVAGIESNNYQTRDIPYEVINKHIDLDVAQLHTMKIEEIGLGPFLWTNGLDIFGSKAAAYLQEKAPSLLAQIVNLHRSILRLSYIRKELVLGMQVGRDYGETWLFGTQEGQTVFDGLMDSLNDACTRHSECLNQFWQVFYTETYTPYARSNNKDDTDKTYKDMQVADVFYQRSTKAQVEIEEQTKKIYDYAKRFKDKIESNEEQKQILIAKLYAHLVHIKEYDEEKLNKLKSIMRTPGSGTREHDIRAAQQLAVQKLYQHGGYSPEDNPPEDLSEEFYQYHHFALFSMQSMSNVEKNKRETRYKAALEKAKAHKASKNAEEESKPTPHTLDEEIRKAHSRAASELAYLGYNLEKIPASLFDDVAQYYWPVTPKTTFKEMRSREKKYHAALDKAAKMHRSIQRSGPSMHNPSRKPVVRNQQLPSDRDIAAQERKAVLQSVTVIPIAAANEPQRVQERAELNSANKKTQIQQGEEVMPSKIPLYTRVQGTTPIEEKTYSKESMKTALAIKKIFNPPIEQFCEDYKSLTTLTSRAHLLSGLHREIYNLLKTESNMADYRWRSRFHLYKWDQWVQLRQHLLRMTYALDAVLKAQDLFEQKNAEQLVVINHYFIRGLEEMCNPATLFWLKIPPSLFELVRTNQLSGELLEELPGDEVRIQSLELKLALSEAKKNRVMAENESVTAENIKLKEELNVSRSEVIMAHARSYRIETDMAELKASMEQRMGAIEAGRTVLPDNSRARRPSLFVPAGERIREAVLSLAAEENAPIGTP